MLPESRWLCRRAAFRKAGVHKSEDYKDLDDYIAVELEFVRYLLEKGDTDAAANFINNHLLNWIPEFHAALYNAAALNLYKGISAFTLSFLFHERNGVNPDYQDAIGRLSEAIDQLNLGDEYYTIAEGVKEEEPEKTINGHCYVCGALCGITDTVKDGILITCIAPIASRSLLSERVTDFAKHHGMRPLILLLTN
jgi:thiosulfate reductase/polysulfide reductase chain A